MAGVNFDALNQVYNHYLVEYAPKTNTSLDTHKKSDLRNIYNSIVKLNKESPLYIIDSSAEAKSYAVGLKESARSFRNSVAAMSSQVNDGRVLDQKIAYSTRPELATVQFVGDEFFTPADAPTFDLEVARLATPQTNMGYFLRSDSRILLPPGTYSFDVSINDLNYEFQFHLMDEDCVLDVQNRLSRLISNADIGLEASVIEEKDKTSSLKLSTTATGILADKEILFSITDEESSQQKGMVDYLGMNQIVQKPTNALFEINGIERTASSNIFSVEKMYEITLKGLSPEPGIKTEIGVKNDVDSLSENVHALAESYNTFIRSVSAYPGAHARNSQLLSELGIISRHYAPSLANVGLTFQKDGTLEIDNQQLIMTVNEDANEAFSPVRDFANSMLRKSSQVSLNPMEYVNKTVVAYKNPGKNFPAPYITSAYSGMLFNNYC